MAPTIHCVRHGQGFHNLGEGFYELPDPKLTPEGEAQCLTLRDTHFSDQSHISLVAASPMSRAIQSAFLTFQPILEGEEKVSRKIIAIPDAQETSDSPCDVGSDLEVLEATCKENHWPVDLSLVEEGWNIKRPGGRYSPSSQAIERRARAVRLFIREQAKRLVAAGDQDAQIVLVAHGGFLHYFTNDWEDAAKRPGTGWINCETRAYTFENALDDNDDDDDDAPLVELMESRRKRGLNHAMFSKAKQHELYEEAMQAWENQGLQNHSKVELGGEELVAQPDQIGGGQDPAAAAAARLMIHVES